MKLNLISYAVFALVSSILVACGTRDNATPSLAITPTSLPAIPHVSATKVPSATSQPARTPLPTPIPTLPPEDALESFTSLIEGSDDCKLPCWLGITPGQSSFEDAVNIFSQFNTIASTKFSSQWAFIRVFFPNFEAAIHNTATEAYPSIDGKISHIRVYAVVNPDKNGNIMFTNSAYQKMWQGYFAPSIFTRFGPPEKIFLDTTRLAVDPAGKFPFVLWIVYPQEGFLIRYEGNNTETGENILVCPMQSRIEIKIWDIKRSSYEDHMKNDEAGGISLGPQPIEGVTKFDIGSFYETFRNGQLDTCFETPASIWPH